MNFTVGAIKNSINVRERRFMPKSTHLGLDRAFNRLLSKQIEQANKQTNKQIKQMVKHMVKRPSYEQRCSLAAVRGAKLCVD